MTLAEFQSWALSQGQVGNPGSGSFPGQCVSLVQQYLDKVYGIPYVPRGNAKDWPTNPDVLSYFDIVTTLQVGDIIVYGADYGGGYGHIGTAIGNNQILDQNGRKSLHVATGPIYPNKIAYLRRKGDNMAKTTTETMRMLYYAFWGQTGQHGTPNALNGDLDADINQNWVGKDLEQTMKDFFYAPQGDAYRKLAAEDATDSKYTPVTEQLFKKK